MLHQTRDADAPEWVESAVTQRQPRLHDPKYLAFLRTKPCCICGREGETEACHIRISWLAMQMKPHDKYAVPMCRRHHRMQHGMNEEEFWRGMHKDPFKLSYHFYAEEYQGVGGKPRQARKIKPRKPRSQRAPIKSRGFPKPHPKSRG